MTKTLRPIKWYKTLSLKKGRDESGYFLVEGEKAIHQIINISPDSIDELVVSDKLDVASDYPKRALTDKQFQYVSGFQAPQGIMAVVKIPKEAYFDTLPDESRGNILLLEDIQDPGNLGTLLRTAAAFDFSGVIMSEKCADPFSPKCVQSAAGAVLSVWLRRSGEYMRLAGHLKSIGYNLVAATLDGGRGDYLCNKKHLVLALGNEASGLSSELLGMANQRFLIPINRNKAESLNVAVSGAICMYLASITDSPGA